MLSCMSICFKWQMWNITDGQRKRWSFGKLPCKYSLKKKNSFISVFLRWSRFWAVKALLVVRNRKFAHLTIFRQFQTFPVRIWKFFKIKDLCSFGNESNRNSSLWLNLCTEKQTFPAFCKMRIIYEGELVKRHNAIVAIFMKFLGSFYCERWGENIAMLQNFQYSLNFGQFLCRWWWETGNLLAQPKASPPHLGLFHKFGIIFNVHQLWK